jgi:hypothetical protein
MCCSALTVHAYRRGNIGGRGLREINLVLSERRKLKPLADPVHHAERFFVPVSIRLAPGTPRWIAQTRTEFRLQMCGQRREQTNNVPKALLLKGFCHANDSSHGMRRGVIAWVS